jgi:two-component system, LytTR family, sensor histidine kinase AgrC
MIDLTLINQFVFTPVEAGIFLFIFCLLAGKRNYPLTHKYAFFIFIIFYTVFTFWVTNYIPFGIHTILVAVFTILYLGFTTKTSLLSSFSIYSLLALSMIVLELAVMLVAMLITGYDFAEVLTHPMIIFIGSIITKLLEGAIIPLAYKLDLERYANIKLFRGENNYPSLILVQAFLLGVIIGSVNYVITNTVDIETYNIFLISLYILFIVLTVVDFKEQGQLRSLHKKHALLQEHLKNIEALISIIRKEKHDFSNHLNTIYGLCTLNKLDMADRIQKYINNISAKPYFSNKTVDTGNDYIDALIAVKNNLAIDLGISLTVDFRNKLDLIDIDDKELVAIFGNIIDNAFDALMSVEEIQNKGVFITSFKIDKTYYISIKNNGPVILERNFKRIFSNGFSTKYGNKADHGYGLYIVNQMVERNGGSINVTSNADETEFLIKLKARGEIRESACEQIV